MIGALLGPIGKIASTWLEGRNEKLRADAETKIAQVRSKAVIAQKQATGEIELQQSLTEQMGDSWKDEFWTILIGGILLCCFLPFTQDYVKKGFEFLSTSTPEWFTHIILISVSASYGLRIGKGAMGVMQKKIAPINKPIGKKK
tara:strand:+ start:5041 stop:5472 length:432 start_codon:yes stop_codon:yes gene_type:complete